MKFLQKLGKALMLPVACLPICGILMGLGYALCPSTMQGGDVVGLVQQIGFFLVKAGGAVIDNMAWLFAIGIVMSAAISAFVCGVTEPFEFAFMFLAPALYVVYAALYGIFTVITCFVGFRAGFCFSAGLTDLIFSASLPAAHNTWMIIPLGIAAFLVFYFVFKFAILKWDLKTPGREDDDDEADDAEKSATLANNDFTAVAQTILEGLGGKENVVTIDNCITRLRLTVKDDSLVDDKKIKSAGVSGVMHPGKNNVQVVIGMQVQFVADEFKKLCK